MAKKSMIERQKKREKIVAKFADKRAALLEEFKTAATPQIRFAVHRKIQQLPRDSAATRNVLREWAHQGLLPGVVKSSW
jgi:small subunit ribosomal protein S14